MAQRTCQNSCVGYDGKSVLQDLSFEALAGDYLCMVGKNGSGKSRLMKTILALQPSRLQQRRRTTHDRSNGQDAGHAVAEEKGGDLQ